MMKLSGVLSTKVSSFEHKYGTEYIIDVFLNKEEIGFFQFDHVNNELLIMEENLFEEHKGKGIEDFVFNYIEDLLSAKIKRIEED